MKKEEKFAILADEISDLYCRKNADYGDSFGLNFDKYGIVSALIRLSDKMNRIERLILGGKQEVNDESVRDTLKDLASYALMTIIELDERKLLK